jgi:hypothetical protein
MTSAWEPGAHSRSQYGSRREWVASSPSGHAEGTREAWTASTLVRCGVSVAMVQHLQGRAGRSPGRWVGGDVRLEVGQLGPLTVQENDGSTKGSIEYRIGLAAPEERINAAVTSLGDRTGDDEQEVAADLQAALDRQLVGLDLEYIRSIAAELTRGPHCRTRERVLRIKPATSATDTGAPTQGLACLWK